jgi:hypothetical protein
LFLLPETVENPNQTPTHRRQDNVPRENNSESLASNRVGHSDEHGGKLVQWLPMINSCLNLQKVKWIVLF